MAHLTCLEHGRRVHVTDENVLHRNDHTECDTRTVKIGKKHYGKWEIQRLIPKVFLKTGELKNVDFTPEERLLKAIFGQNSPIQEF
jgi:hypothetical protein